MKLLRYGPPGEEKPGLLDADNQIRDLSSYIYDLNPQGLKQLQLHKLDIKKLPKIAKPQRLGACLINAGKVICIGYNTKLHAKEMGMTTLPQNEIMFFLKASSALCGPYDPILYTRHTKKLDWEAELGIIIGKQGKYIDVKNADDFILGYTCINDLSDRYWQLETADKQFTKGKSFDNAAPIGPYIVTKDEINDAHNLQIKLWVNGALCQNFNTSDYIHKEKEIISYLSQFFTLHPGDIISMGSAPGSAKSMGETCYLKPQDEVILEIEGLGQQKKQVIIED